MIERVVRENAAIVTSRMRSVYRHKPIAVPFARHKRRRRSGPGLDLLVAWRYNTISYYLQILNGYGTRVSLLLGFYFPKGVCIVRRIRFGHTLLFRAKY